MGGEIFLWEIGLLFGEKSIYDSHISDALCVPPLGFGRGFFFYMPKSICWVFSCTFLIMFRGTTGIYLNVIKLGFKPALTYVSRSIPLWYSVLYLCVTLWYKNLKMSVHTCFSMFLEHRVTRSLSTELHEVSGLLRANISLLITN